MAIIFVARVCPPEPDSPFVEVEDSSYGGYEKWRCDNISCGWERNISLKFEHQRIDHPVWGKTTVGYAAARDMAEHDCVNHSIALEKARRSAYQAKLSGKLPRR